MTVFLQGIVMGVAVAAPVGPIGLLCIRRTLLDGRAAGLATGMGAAVADGLYGLVVAAGLALTGLLVSHAEPLALGGGLLLAALGASAIRGFFRNAPRHAATPGGRGLLGAFATTFLLTLANPATILTFVALVAGLGSAAARSPEAPYWLVLGVFLGSALWWLVLVHLTLIVRTRLTPAATRWLDLGSGLLFVGWGLALALGALR